METLVSIIVPTKNEEKNTGRLLTEIAASVTLLYEAIVADDSDNNQTAVIALAQEARVIQGQHKGLGQAILDGIKASSGDIVVVMDADLSHNPHTIPGLIRPILEQGYDMTIGSRYVTGGSSSEWTFARKIISKVACLFALPITRTRDATSGFFAFRKSLIDNVELKPTSWKIMLEILVKANPTRVLEIPIQFGKRYAGKSKLGSKQMIDYLKHIALLCCFKYKRFAQFCITGGSGAIIALAIIWILTDKVGLWYMLSAVIATVVVSIWNYNINAFWTFARQGRS